MRIPISRIKGVYSVKDADGDIFTQSQIINWVNGQAEFERELKEAKELAEKNRLRYEKTEVNLHKVIGGLRDLPSWLRFFVKPYFKSNGVTLLHNGVDID